MHSKCCTIYTIFALCLVKTYNLQVYNRHKKSGSHNRFVVKAYYLIYPYSSIGRAISIYIYVFELLFALWHKYDCAT